jgi:AcrR family transcriptional regulator
MKKETVERRRREIFKVALKVFAEKGFDRATLDEMAEHLHISKPAIYLYFKNKELLFLSMFEEKVQILQKRVGTMVTRKLPALDKLRELVIIQVDFFKENRDFFEIMQTMAGHLHTSEHSSIKIKLKENFMKLVQQVQTLIREAVRKGSLKRLDPQLLSFALLGMVQNTMMGYFMSKQTAPLKTLDRDIFELFLKGAGT